MKIAKYKDLGLEKKVATPVTKDEVNQELQKLLASSVKYNKKEGKSELGDTVNIDYEGLLDGVPFDGGKAEHYDLELGSHTFIPGFEEGLVGFEVGNDVDVNVTFPQEYHSEALAGKPVVFKCHIHEVKTRVNAQLNDEFAKEYGFNDADSLVKALESQMNLNKEKEANNEYLSKLIKEVVDNSDVDIPADMVDKRTEMIISYLEQNIAQYGMNLDNYLAMSNQTMDDLKDQAKEQAKEAVKSDIVLLEIASIEGISATEEEIDATFDQYRVQHAMTQEEFTKFKEANLEALSHDLVIRKVLDLLLTLSPNK